jgi:hypothetical protein
VTITWLPTRCQQLLRLGQVPLRVGQLRVDGGDAGRDEPAATRAERRHVHLPAAVLPGLHNGQIRERAELEAAEEARPLVRQRVLVGQPERHPLQVRLVRHPPAPRERPLGPRGVVLRAVVPGVVGHLVVVEDRDPGVLPVCRRQIRVGLV